LLGIGARSSAPDPPAAGRLIGGKCAQIRDQLAKIRAPRLGSPYPIEAKKCSKNNDLEPNFF